MNQTHPAERTGTGTICVPGVLAINALAWLNATDSRMIISDKNRKRGGSVIVAVSGEDLFVGNMIGIMNQS